VLQIAQFDAQHLANTAWSFATLHIQDLPLLMAISDTAIKQIPNFGCQDLANTTWAFAVVMFRDLPLLEALSQQALSRRWEMQPQNLSNTAWAFATLRVVDLPLVDAISEAATQIISEFDLQGIANILWSYASLRLRDFPIISSLQQTVVSAATLVASVLEEQRPSYQEAARYSNHLCQLVWALSFIGKLEGELAASLKGLMLDFARRQDKECQFQGSARAKTHRMAEEPTLILKLRGISVVLKPAHWEVDAKGQLSETGLYLSHFMQEVHEPSPVLHLQEFEYGFIHRLDVPSSGLILAGTGFEGYALLQWQIHSYTICREYAVLLRGHVPGDLSIINVPVQDFLPGRSFVDENGQPAETHLKATFHARRNYASKEHFGLVCIAIHTGRRHQIRVHTQWQGYPTVTDEKYSHRSVAVSAQGLDFNRCLPPPETDIA